MRALTHTNTHRVEHNLCLLRFLTLISCPERARARHNFSCGAAGDLGVNNVFSHASMTPIPTHTHTHTQIPISLCLKGRHKGALIPSQWLHACACTCAAWVYVVGTGRPAGPIPNKPFQHTQSSKAARLCGAPVCPRHTEADRASLSFSRRLKQQDTEHGELSRGGRGSAFDCFILSFLRRFCLTAENCSVFCGGVRCSSPSEARIRGCVYLHVNTMTW